MKVIKHVCARAFPSWHVTTFPNRLRSYRIRLVYNFYHKLNLEDFKVKFNITKTKARLRNFHICVKITF